MTGAAIFLASAAAGLIQSVTGFGAGIMTMLVFPLFFPMVEAAALSAAIALALSSTLAWRYRKVCPWKLIVLPAFFYLITTSVAILGAPYLPTELLKRVFGVFLILLSLYFLLLDGKIKAKADLPTAMLCAGLSGLTGGFFGIGGPPMVVYFLAALDDKERYIATIQLFFAITGGYMLVLRVASGIFTAELGVYTVIGVIAITLGKLVGIRIIDRINTETMKKIVYVFLGISGVLNLL